MMLREEALESVPGDPGGSPASTSDDNQKMSSGSIIAIVPVGGSVQSQSPIALGACPCNG
jgi:hypothetical protein